MSFNWDIVQIIIFIISLIPIFMALVLLYKLKVKVRLRKFNMFLFQNIFQVDINLVLLIKNPKYSASCTGH